VTGQQMTLEEVAHAIDCPVPGWDSCTGFAIRIECAAAIRAHKCEPDPAEYVEVERVREVLRGLGSYWRDTAPVIKINRILPHPDPENRGPLELIERHLERYKNGEIKAVSVDAVLALVREARKEQRK
jgi:predicted short-subunit dehydrogenase-like oxidoreductase (DUF2520 family)